MLSIMIYLALISSLLALGIAIVIYINGRSGDKLDSLLDDLKKIQARQSREIDQMRYTIASLRKKTREEGGEETEGEDPALSESEAEKQMLEQAVAEMEKIQAHKPKSLSENNIGPTEDKKYDRDDPKWQYKPETADSRLGDKEILSLVKEAIKNNRIDIQLQPIVDNEHRRVKHYEVFSRIRAGKAGFISAGRFMSLAKNEALIPILDNLILLRCLHLIKGAQRGDLSCAYFVNIAGSSVENVKFMDQLILYLGKNPRLSSRIICELKQSDLRGRYKNIRPVLEELSLVGVRISMDNITDFKLDIERLLESNVSFVKLNAQVLEKMFKDKALKQSLLKMKKYLLGHGIEIIGEKVENNAQLRVIKELGIYYGQGYFLGAPR